MIFDEYHKKKQKNVLEPYLQITITHVTQDN